MLLRRTMLGAVWCVAAVGLACGRAIGQEAPVPGGGAAAERAARTYVAGKPELARAYRELEGAVRENAEKLDAATLGRVNRGFDTAANSFFTGQFGAAVCGINAELERIHPGTMAIHALGVRAQPMVVRVGEHVETTIRVAPICEAAHPDGAWEIGLSHGHDKIEGSSGGRLGTVTLDAAPLRGETRVLVNSVRPTRWTVQFFDAHAPGGGWVDGCTIYSTPEPLDAVRERALKRLEGVEKEHPELGAALMACRSRARLLSDAPSTDNTYVLVGDLLTLAAGVEREAESLAAGRDPYKDAAGDFWLGLKVGEVEVPCRLLAPATEHPETPRPLIIAVHGAGGDENLWMDGYGVGVLREEAERRNVLVVTPRVGIGTFMPGTVDGLIEAVAKWHAVDRSRVYVLGHSLGGGIVTAWAKQRPETIAAACSIAGIGMFSGTEKIAPMRAYAAALDGLVVAGRIKRSAVAAAEAGLPVEYVEVPNYGHVLVVGKVTPEAVGWLLEHRLAGHAAGERTTNVGRDGPAAGTAPETRPAGPGR